MQPPTDSRLDAVLKIGTVMNATVPRLEHAGDPWEGSTKFVIQLEAVLMAAGRGCSNAMGNAVLRREKMECTHVKQIETRESINGKMK